MVLTKVLCATTIHKTKKTFELRALCIHIRCISQLSASIHTLHEHVAYETRRAQCMKKALKISAAAQSKGQVDDLTVKNGGYVRNLVALYPSYLKR